MADSIFMQCLEGIRDAIIALSIPGLAANRIAVRRYPHDGEVFFPGVTVHPVEEIYHPGTNMREGIGYGCAVTIVVNNDNDKDYLLDRLLLWRETIRRYFVENDNLASVSNGVSYTLKVEHGAVIDISELYRKNYDVSRLIIRVYVLETRT